MYWGKMKRLHFISKDHFKNAMKPYVKEKHLSKKLETNYNKLPLTMNIF